ncbi:MAG: tetratricopeptide repeat protein, partial [Bacteroidetes bacterium]
LFLLIPWLLCAQTADKVSIEKKVDSLIQASKFFVNQSNFEKALEINQAAEQLALEELGEESVPYANCCNNHGMLMYYAGNLSEAEFYWQKTKGIREKVQGRAHADYAGSLINLSLVYQQKTQLEKAKQVLLEAKEIFEDALHDRKHPYYINGLAALAQVYFFSGEYDKAEALFTDVVTAREESLGKHHPQYAIGLNNLAMVYKATYRYTKAEALFLEARSIFEQSLGKKHPQYLTNIEALATLYKDMGRFREAEAIYLEILDIWEKSLGKMNPRYASNVNKLALLYMDMSQYEKAEPLYLEAKAIWEKLYGKQDAKYGLALNNLAVLYYEMGQYEKAEPLFLEVIEIWKNSDGNDHDAHYAEALINLANVNHQTGQFKKAESLFLKAKSIFESDLKNNSASSLASALRNMGNLYTDMGEFEKAERHYLEAKAISEEIYGKEHLKYFRSLHQLGSFYATKGQYKEAESMLLEANTAIEKVLGREHPHYLVFTQELASLYFVMGQYDKAINIYLESGEIVKKVYNPEHPFYTHSLNNIGLLYYVTGQYKKAEPYFLESAFESREQATKTLLYLSEREQANYLNKYAHGQDKLLSLCLNAATDSLVMAAYDNSLFYKGFLLNAAGQVKRLAHKDPVSTEKFNQLKGFRRRLAKQYALTGAERSDSTVQMLETRANEVEKELIRTVAGYGNNLRQVKWSEVQASLKDGEAAIEFTRYRCQGKVSADSIMYAALVLLPGDAAPEFISLFAEKSLDSLLLTQGGRKADYVNNLYMVAERGVIAVHKPRKSLYELVWQPLEPALKATKTIYFSPAGLLHRINLNAIPLDEERTLADKFNLVQVNSTRRLVVPVSASVAANDAVLFGGIQYQVDSTASASPDTGNNYTDLSSRGELSFSYTDSTLRGSSWDYLKWTRKEVESISAVLNTANYHTTTLTDHQASEEAFQALGQKGTSPKVLHLATHGFFFPDPEDGTGTRSGLEDSEPVFKMSDHPMIRSGLILAGGNYAWQGKPALPGTEDGILTAYEISQMNLSGTELVVLSACETGLGDIQGNEGVYGLQRAFKMAGAKYLIMSLWQVPDRETKDFMTTFYQHWLEGAMTIPEAFRKTQQEMKERFYNPFQWAGFVLVE